MKVPFLDLRVTDAARRQRLLAAVDRVLQHGRLLLGPELDQFEEAMAADCGRRYCVGVGSGTAALYLALKCAGIGPGDEVITTSLSWIATANAIAMTGATPVFADLRDDLNLDPDSVARLITPRTRALVPVHYTGRVCRMDALMEIARRHGLMVIEDAAQAFRATLGGRRAGSFGELACFSANPMKVFAGCGEAGFIVMDRQDYRERLLALRYSGAVRREICYEPGLNFRMDTLQAAILLQRLKEVDQIIARRREIAQCYRQLLGDVVQTPREADDERHIYYTFTIQVDRRDELQAFLAEQEIETKIHHRRLLPQQPAYADNARGEFSRATRLVQRILSIPANETMSREQVEYVAAQIRRFYRQQ